MIAHSHAAWLRGCAVGFRDAYTAKLILAPCHPRQIAPVDRGRAHHMYMVFPSHAVRHSGKSGRLIGEESGGSVALRAGSSVRYSLPSLYYYYY